MRFAIIFARTHDNEVQVVAGPGNSEELNKQFKQFALEKEHDDYAEMFFHEIYLSQGRKRIAFDQPEAPTGDGLDDKTIEELTALGDDEDADLTGAKLKQDYIDRIRAFRTLNEKTIADLEQLASEESVDVSGCKLKKDFVNTIASARRAKNQQPPA